MSEFVEAAFNKVTRRMEQHPDEIRPFAEWLYRRQPVNAVEIGVRHGGTASLWLELCSGIVVGVDWLGQDGLGENTLTLAEEMMTENDRYRFVCGDSHDPKTFHKVLEVLDGETIDLLFLDGDHTLQGVTSDYYLYNSLVSRQLGNGGCIAFHDIVDTPFIRSVGHGVCDFWKQLQGNKKEFNINADWGGIGVIEV